ncbi:SH3 domain-containing protein [uncultured Ramlibacter sp.]|uniref:SH3 domain-containing protein n=1 Tax=uncultured Ramlibacter sp. TaxID=260755 RepID=UPI0026083032|nr:SH3 domain-containing protein [uncultured Ramlibacter sp.]
MALRAWRGLWLAALLACGTAQAQAQTPEEAAVMKRAADLRETPAETGRSLAALPAQAPITRLGGRQGPWVQVRSEAGATGWVHLFDVGPASGGAGSNSGNAATGALRGITSLFSKGGTQRTATTPTSTIGIRGLGAEDLAQAQPNAAAVAQMEGLRQSEGQAREFARDASLAQVNVQPLPAPVRPAGGAARNAEQLP